MSQGNLYHNTGRITYSTLTGKEVTEKASRSVVSAKVVVICSTIALVMWNEQGLNNLTHPVCNARHFQGPDIQRFVVGERNLLPSDPQLVARQIFYVHV